MGARRLGVGARRLTDRARQLAVAEAGIGLIELLISASMLILIAIGTLTAFDSSGRFTTNEQRRSQADSLAQQDEDALRGIPVDQLANLSATKQVTLNGTTFTIKEQAQFVTETTGNSSCSTTGSADYIQTTSTVTWPSMGATPPVTAQSVITPSAGGSLVIDVVDSQGNGVPNMSVSGSGASNLSGTTGSNGCAIFAGLPGGSYNISVSQPGYVDVDGNSTPPASKQSTTVVEGASTTKVFQFDKGGTITASFTTIPYGGSSPQPTNGDVISMVNPGMTFPSIRWAGTLGTFSQTVSSSSTMFPFTSGYTVYAGSCSADEPSNNGATDPPAAVVPPGGTVNVPLQLPPIYLTVMSGSSSSSPGTPVSGAHVVITDQGCGGNPPSQGGSPLLERTMSTNSSGQLPNPGLPYGSYKVCADNGSRMVSATVANNVLTGTPLTFYLGANSNPRGVCT